VLVDSQLQIAFLNVTGGILPRIIFLESMLTPLAILTVISQIAIAVVAAPPMSATIPLLAGVGYLIQRVYLRTSRQVRLMDLEAKAPLCTHFLESLAGIATIRSFGWVSAYRRRNNERLDQSQIPFYLLSQIQNWLALVSSACFISHRLYYWAYALLSRALCGPRPTPALLKPVLTCISNIGVRARSRGPCYCYRGLRYRSKNES